MEFVSEASTRVLGVVTKSFLTVSDVVILSLIFESFESGLVIEVSSTESVLLVSLLLITVSSKGGRGVLITLVTAMIVVMKRTELPQKHDRFANRFLILTFVLFENL